ncbi:hypothetical protein [Streptomyces sp. HPF1205]|uniref:hypothetical protein n=1 Tax=Streptomyces sp. HPF1205 TaxID=2873262 RepID=UPI001CECAADD|nr:hypothetical protein [Streptomyces sp. HPF1205]
MIAGAAAPGGRGAPGGPAAPASTAPGAAPAAPVSPVPPAAALIRPVADLLREVVGEDDAWLDRVDAGTRVDGDLLVESHELAAWSLALRGRYGERIDLVAYVAGLDIDRIIALTVGEVAAYVAARGDGATPAADGAR